jgi:hypothetical protein
MGLKIDPENPILTTYCTFKKVQKFFSDGSGVERRQAEIDAVFAKNAEIDLCPIIRYVALWVPASITLAMAVFMYVVAVVCVFIAVFMLPFDQFIKFVTELGIFLGLVILGLGVLALVGYGIYRLVKAMPKTTKRVLHAIAGAATTASTPARNALPVIAAFAEAAHDRFCLRAKVSAL